MPSVHRRLLRQGWTSRAALSLAVGVGLSGACLAIAQAGLLGAIVTRVFEGGGTLRSLAPALTGLALVVALRAGLAWAAEMAGHLCASRVKSHLRSRLAGRVLDAGPAYLGSERTGELAAAAGQGIDALDAYFGRLLPQVGLGVLIPLVVVAWVARADPISALVIAVTVPLIPLFMWLIGAGAGRRARRRWHALSVLSAHFLDVIAGLPTLQLFGRDRHQREVIREVTDRFRSATMATLRLAFLSSLVLELGAAMGTALVAVGIGLRLVNGTLGLQTGLTVLLLTPEAYLPLRLLGSSFHTGADAQAAAGRIFDVIDSPTPRARIGPGREVDLSSATIRLEEVTVTYPGRPLPALDRVSLEIRPGERIALVGPSGAGKSTVLSLLLGFMRPTSGQVAIGGVALDEIDPQSWRRQISWLPQRPHLFHGSIIDNVRLGAPTAGEPAVSEALDRAGLGSWIASLPEGLETQVGERGARLSGGQRQRLALARAIIRPAPLLLLDEPSANLDPEATGLVQEALDRLAPDRTVLSVVHDPALARRAGRVIVLDGGRVATGAPYLAVGGGR